jgi:hypothetical protein
MGQGLRHLNRAAAVDAGACRRAGRCFFRERADAGRSGRERNLETRGRPASGGAGILKKASVGSTGAANIPVVRSSLGTHTGTKRSTRLVAEPEGRILAPLEAGVTQSEIGRALGRHAASELGMFAVLLPGPAHPNSARSIWQSDRSSRAALMKVALSGNLRLTLTACPNCPVPASWKQRLHRA